MRTNRTFAANCAATLASARSSFGGACQMTTICGSTRRGSGRCQFGSLLLGERDMCQQDAAESGPDPPHSRGHRHSSPRLDFPADWLMASEGKIMSKRPARASRLTGECEGPEAGPRGARNARFWQDSEQLLRRRNSVSCCGYY